MIFHLTPSALSEDYGDALLPLALAKSHLRVDGDDEDDLIVALRDAAVDMVEQYANLRMGPVTGMVARFDGFGERMRVGVGPLGHFVVTGVSYVDSAGETIELGDGGWRVDVSGGLVPPIPTLAWPGASDVTVTFSAGYPAGQCPAALLAAARLFLGHLYINREAVITGTISSDLPLSFTALCDRYRMPVL